MKYTLSLIAIIGVALVLMWPEKHKYISKEIQVPPPTIRDNSSEPNGDISVRFLVLKHSHERMADHDAELAIQAANAAAAQGLDIHVIGNEYIHNMDTEQIQSFVKEKMKQDAKIGDTLIIHTIGHGSESGYLDNIGKRSELMAAFVKASEETGQETLWWQLSCHAAAYLPGINTLNNDTQEIFSILASSSAEDLSSSETQARVMGQLFNAMALRSPSVDPNGDDSITALELRNYLNTLDGQRRGDLLFAKAPDELIFARWIDIRLIPFIGGRIPHEYIPIP